MSKQRIENARKPAGKPNFEKSLEELEAIVAEMESGKLGLEEMIQRFEKGRELVNFCAEKLNEVEKKIEILVRKGDETTAEPFEPGEDVGGELPAGEEAEEKVDF